MNGYEGKIEVLGMQINKKISIKPKAEVPILCKADPH